MLGSRMLNFIVFRCLRRRCLNSYRLSDQHECGARAGCLGGWGYPSSMGDYENKSLETMDNAGDDGQGMITAVAKLMSPDTRREVLAQTVLLLRTTIHM